jgi:hypothetical protein
MITPETNKEHIDRLYKRVEGLIDSIVEIKQILDSMESKLKLLVWAKEIEHKKDPLVEAHIKIREQLKESEKNENG